MNAAVDYKPPYFLFVLVRTWVHAVLFVTLCVLLKLGCMLCLLSLLASKAETK